MSFCNSCISPVDSRLCPDPRPMFVLQWCRRWNSETLNFFSSSAMEFFLLRFNNFTQFSCLCFFFRFFLPTHFRTSSSWRRCSLLLALVGAGHDDVRVVPYFVHPDSRRGVLVLHACAPRLGSQSSLDQASPWFCLPSFLSVCVSVKTVQGLYRNTQRSGRQNFRQPTVVCRWRL